MTVISVENVSKRFPLNEGEFVKAVDDVELQVKEGDSVAILGPSGCGKTTLLRVIAGLEAPDDGEVLYDGVPIDDTVRAVRRQRESGHHYR
jgi:ABC-type Fe3+/spermidine/putrescine transport system ATPase subunit